MKMDLEDEKMIDPRKVEKEAINFQNAGKFEGAIKAWEELLDNYPDWEYGYSHLELSYCYSQLGNFEKALEAIKKALEFDPNNEYFVGNYEALLEDRKRGLI